jgi:MFS superfamily sulfate permease-like transporter
LGVLLGDSALPLLAAIPPAVLGSLLFFSGVELAFSSQPQNYAGRELFAVLVIAALAVATNPAVAFVVGLPLAHALERGLVRL